MLEIWRQTARRTRPERVQAAEGVVTRGATSRLLVVLTFPSSGSADAVGSERRLHPQGSDRASDGGPRASLVDCLSRLLHEYPDAHLAPRHLVLLARNRRKVWCQAPGCTGSSESLHALTISCLTHLVMERQTHDTIDTKTAGPSLWDAEAPPRPGLWD